MKVLYIGRIQLPNKDAASLRVYNVGYAVKKGGHSVDFLCMENYASEPVAWEDSTYYFVFSKEASGLEKNREWLFGNQAIRKLRDLQRANPYDVVILYNITADIARKVLAYCREEHISVLSDVTEWYEFNLPRSINGFFSLLYSLGVDRRIRSVDRKLNGVIAISSYLFDYYQHQGQNVIRIPPVFYYDREYADPDNAYRTILYAGRPAKKDEVNILMEAVEAVNKDKMMLKMIFVGVDQPDNPEVLSEKGIIFMPRCDNSQVVEYVRNSDFTVLFRRNKRFAKAGYSTKVAESLFNGVPVICNEIGGTDADIEDGINGIKIKGLSMKEVCEGLMRIVSMRPEECIRMRKNCREMGDRLYNANHYAEQTDSFLRHVSVGK